MTVTGRPKGTKHPTGARMGKHPLEPKTHLPGQQSIKEGETLRVTKTTFLPTCSKCRGYPAQLVNGIYLCRGQHD